MPTRDRRSRSSAFRGEPIQSYVMASAGVGAEIIALPLRFVLVFISIHLFQSKPASALSIRSGLSYLCSLSCRLQPALISKIRSQAIYALVSADASICINARRETLTIPPSRIAGIVPQLAMR